MNEELTQQICDFAKSAYNYDGDVTPETTFETLGKGSMPRSPFARSWS